MQIERNGTVERVTPHRAFTLVELLVAIGILTIIVTLLLPAVSAAVESSRRAQCASSLRQLSQATTLLAMNNDNVYRIPSVRLSVAQANAKSYQEAPSANGHIQHIHWMSRHLFERYKREAGIDLFKVGCPSRLDDQQNFLTSSGTMAIQFGSAIS